MSDTPPPRPMWVKVLIAIFVVIVAAVVIMAVSGGEHGPGRHLPGGHGAPAEHDS